MKPCESDLEDFQVLKTSNNTTTTPRKNRLVIKANVGMTNTEGWTQEPGHTLQYKPFDVTCVNEAI